MKLVELPGATPCFIQVLGVFVIPESPRWLVSYYFTNIKQVPLTDHLGKWYLMSFYWQSKIGLEKEVEASLQRLRGKNADISTEAAEIKVTDWSKMSNEQCCLHVCPFHIFLLKSSSRRVAMTEISPLSNRNLLKQFSNSQHPNSWICSVRDMLVLWL